MSKGRMEAFSDGVFAVIITIMVLEMKSPHGTSLEALMPLIPVFSSYVLSFIYVGILPDQSSPPVAGSAACCGRRALGKLASALLAFINAVCHSLNGENPLAPWPVALNGGAFIRFHRLFHPNQTADCSSGCRLCAGEINWE